MAVIGIGICAGVAQKGDGREAAAKKQEKLIPRALTFAEQGGAKWSTGPEAAVKVAPIYGDPDKPGMFIEWMNMPPHTKTPPHWHRGDETITVLSGSIFMAAGDKLDESAGTEVKAGGFVMAPARSPHYGWTVTGAIIQVQGEGPFSMNWIDAGK